MYKRLLASMLVSSTLLVACSSPRTEVPISESSSTSQEKQVPTGKELFEAFIHAYENDTFSDGVEYPPQKQPYKHYAFYDINQDGVEELLVGSLQEDGSVYLATVFHYEDLDQDSQRKFHMYQYGGSYRGSYRIFKDGTVVHMTWIPVSGEGTATTYHLNDGSTEFVTDRELDIQLPLDNLEETLGLAGVAEVDLRTLIWQEFTFSLPELDLEAISQGDFTSLAGEWKRKDGTSLFIDEFGQTNLGARIFMDNATMEAGVLLGTIGDGHTGAAFVLAPKHTTYDIGFVGGTDLSDTSADRIIIAQNTQMEDSAYYRVND